MCIYTLKNLIFFIIKKFFKGGARLHRNYLW